MSDEPANLTETEEKKNKNKDEAVLFVLPALYGVRKSIRDQKPRSVLWLITFTDIMALMLTFFVLLYAMSVPAEEEWESLSSAFDIGFSKAQITQNFQGSAEDISIDKLDFTRALDLSYLKALVDEIIDENETLKNVVLIPQKDRLIVSLPDELLFDSGKADVKTLGKRALFSLGGPLSRIRNRIEIIGHTDPRSVQQVSDSFSSNWELSLARALSVAAVLDNVGYTRDMVVRGLSSARYEELPETLPLEKRLSYARRVDIVIMKDDGSRRFLLQ